MKIRTATPGDAEAIAAVIGRVAAERVYTAITAPWTVEEQRAYLAALSPREAVHVAEVEGHGIVGYQVLDLWAPALASMSHVGQIGTFLDRDWRGQGIGTALFRRTVEFARGQGYSKFVIQVRAANGSAQAFYERLGFRRCGVLARQVRIDGREEDELLMEYFL